MTQALVIDENVLQQLQQLREHAENNPITLTDLQAIMAGAAVGVGQRPGYLITVPIGISIAYSIEEHPGRWMKHLSVSANGKLPSVAMMEQMLELMQFASPMDRCYLYMEQGGRVMNALEAADGTVMAQGAYLGSV